MADDFSLSRIDKTRFRPTVEAEEFLEALRRSLIHGEKFRSARLAFARSLTEASPPELVEKGTEMGGAIEGTHLFGEETAVWGTLFAQAAGAPVESMDAFRQLVEAHWRRGAKLLQADFDSVAGKEVEFAALLASMVPGQVFTPVRQQRGEERGSLVRLTLRVGEVGIEQRANVPAEITLNAPGVSPHLAVMGKTRSGKTRTGLVMAQRIAEDAHLPVLIIDPKGEFVKDGSFVSKSEWGGKTLAERFPNIEALDVPHTPIPLDFLSLAPDSPRTVVAQAAISFRDSFQKCIKARGDVAMDTLRETVELLLREGTGPVSLDRVRDAIRENNESAGRKKDTVQAKLNELTSLRLFEPTLAPAEFFSRRWVVGLGSATEESRRLVMFLLLDALSHYVLPKEDAATDSNGNRGTRHLLVLDEAKEILAYRHNALSNLIRKGAAKGEIVMLLSQSPEDFDKETDDFLSQMGTIIVFTSNAKSLRNLRTALGKRVEPEQFSDKELPRGVAWVKMAGREPVKVIAWK